MNVRRFSVATWDEFNLDWGAENEPFVRASDYDALATRLAEAERKYTRVKAVLDRIFTHYGPPRDAVDDDDHDCTCFTCELQRELAEGDPL